MPTEQMTEPQEQTAPPSAPRGRTAPTTQIETRKHGEQPLGRAEPIFEVREVGVSYNGTPAVRNISLDIGRNRITALIGPSGCGKSTLIRCFNRMNDLIIGATRRRVDPLPRPGPVRHRRRSRSRCAS